MIENPALAKLRDEIDQVDIALVVLLQKRFEIVDRVIEVKNKAGIAAMLPDRIERVVQNVVARASDTKVPRQAVEKIWRILIAETITYEERVLGQK